MATAPTCWIDVMTRVLPPVLVTLTVPPSVPEVRTSIVVPREMVGGDAGQNKTTGHRRQRCCSRSTAIRCCTPYHAQRPPTTPRNAP